MKICQVGTSLPNQQHPDENEHCCIHCTDSEEPLLTLSRRETWETLQRAASIRQHVLPQTVNGDQEMPKLSFHRKCYQYFTMKSILDKIQEKSRQLSLSFDAIDNYETDSGNRPKRDSSSSFSNLLPKNCLFCKKNKYVNRRLEKLIPCSEFRAIKSIRNAAKAKEDFEMLSLASQDLIALEAHYHVTCYKNYTKVQDLKSGEKKGEDPYKTLELSAFKEVVKFCHRIIENPRIVKFQTLLKSMEEQFRKNDETMRDSTRFYLRRNLEKHVIDMKYINVKGTLFLYPKSLSVEVLIPEYIDLQNRFNELQQSNVVNSKTIVECGKQVRKEIKELKDTLPWPPQPRDLQPNNICIPRSLELLMDTMLGNRPYRLKASIAQDLIYNVSGGRIRTPKCILLPSLVKTLTNNTELIHVLNRLGHGLSYSLLMEVQTENAFQIFENQLESGCIIPVDTKKEGFTIFVADNIDRQEETLSGYGTTHKVNSLLIQFGGDFESDIPTNSPRRKRSRRSFQPAQDIDLTQIRSSGKRIGPGPLKFPLNEERDLLFGERERENFLWSMLRCYTSPQPTIPSWTGFHITILNDVPVIQSNVQYLDCIDAPATDISTIYMVLERALSIVESLHLVSIVCVFDQAIYSKACEIKWKEPTKFRSCVLMMGVFHLIMVFMNILYKRFGDAGLKDALIQSSVVAEGSVDAALRGKQYNRGIRLYKIFYESLQRLIISHINDTLGEGDLQEMISKIESQNVFTRVLFEEVSSSEAYCQFLNAYIDLKIQWKKAADLRSFWVSYIEMVDILLNLIYSVRSGSWSLLLESMRNILPFAFAYDHINYARYLTNFLGDMLALEDEYPEIHQQLERGNFAAQLTPDKKFSRVETDKVIEMTLNKDTKTPGGTTGFSTNIGAVKRWETNAPYRAALRRCLHDHLSFENKAAKHKDMMESRIKRDEKDVLAVVNVLSEIFIQPFSDNPLLSISTGITVPDDSAKLLLTAEDLGKAAMKSFMDDRLSDSAKLSLFDPIKKMKIPGFVVGKKKMCKAQSKMVIIRSDKNLFSKIAIIAQKRSVNMKLLFTYPLGSVPLSLAEPDGTLKKTPKSVLLHHLEQDVEPIPTIPDGCALIVDGMAAVRQLKFTQLTYRGFAMALLKQVMSMGRNARRIDVVFDTYLNNSIKDIERNRRCQGRLELQQVVPAAVIKQWNVLLSSNDNKNKLIAFIVEEWKKEFQMVENKTIYVNVASIGYKIDRDGYSREPSLDSDQEEADTRLLLHAHHASETFTKIVISSPDTDVFMIALSKCLDVPADLYILTGTKNARRIIDINAVAEEAHKVFNECGCDKGMFLKALLGYHCFTGCDSISSFCGRGKIKPLKILGQRLAYVEGLSELGSNLVLSDAISRKLKHFVCHMYGKSWTSVEDADIDYLRYCMYCQRGGNIETLPPCKNVLKQHMVRANYQAYIWRQCFEQFVALENPETHGWRLTNGKLDILWMTCNPAPEEVIELIACNCRRCGTNCQCVMNDLSCTDACGCSNCDNEKDDEMDDMEDTTNSDSGSDDDD